MNFYIKKKRDDAVIQELLSHIKLRRCIINPSDASILMGIENTWKSDDISSQCKTTALVQLELAFISIAFFIFHVIRSSATMCFAKPSNHQLHCLKFGLNCHFNSFLSIDFQMTFIPSSPIALPWHECAVTNGMAGLSGGYNDLPLRQKSSSLHLRCNEGKEWIASLPPGSQK